MAHVMSLRGVSDQADRKNHPACSGSDTGTNIPQFARGTNSLWANARLMTCATAWVTCATAWAHGRACSASSRSWQCGQSSTACSTSAAPPTRAGFDPYPYILLNLMLSMVAGLQGAILKIAAKRSDQISSEVAMHTYDNTNKFTKLLQKVDDLAERSTDISACQVRRSPPHRLDSRSAAADHSAVTPRPI